MSRCEHFLAELWLQVQVYYSSRITKLHKVKTEKKLIKLTKTKTQTNFQFCKNVCVCFCASQLNLADLQAVKEWTKSEARREEGERRVVWWMGRREGRREEETKGRRGWILLQLNNYTMMGSTSPIDWSCI